MYDREQGSIETVQKQEDKESKLEIYDNATIRSIVCVRLEWDISRPCLSRLDLVVHGKPVACKRVDDEYSQHLVVERGLLYRNIGPKANLRGHSPIHWRIGDRIRKDFDKEHEAVSERQIRGRVSDIEDQLRVRVARMNKAGR